MNGRYSPSTCQELVSVFLGPSFLLGPHNIGHASISRKIKLSVASALFVRVCVGLHGLTSADIPVNAHGFVIVYPPSVQHRSIRHWVELGISAITKPKREQVSLFAEERASLNGRTDTHVRPFPDRYRGGSCTDLQGLQEDIYTRFHNWRPRLTVYYTPTHEHHYTMHGNTYAQLALAIMISLIVLGTAVILSL